MSIGATDSNPDAVKRSAEISACGRYRYELRRSWDASRPWVLFIGLNPSTADATKDDATSRVCINYARRWGYGGLLLGNLFAYRSTDPAGLYACRNPVGPENDAWLRRLQKEAALVVCAWTSGGGYRDRDRKILRFLRAPHCLVRLRSGYPGHPLYKRSDLRPVPYER
jgi:hypothetical protein